MASYSLTLDLALYEVAHVENALWDGYPPAGLGRHLSAAGAAAKQLHIPATIILQKRVGTPENPLSGYSYRKFKDARLVVDWGFCNPNLPAPIEPSDPDESQQPSADPVEVRQLKDRITRLAAELVEQQRRTADAENIREGVLKITRVPLRPRVTLPSGIPDHGGRQAVIVHISDVHCGEVIQSEEILGANRYDMEVFRARIGRLFHKAAHQITMHWPRSDEPPVEIVVCLGGDLVSGSIHLELAETNEGTDYEIFKEVAERIAGGIAYIRSETGHKIPVRVMSVPGNHARQSERPQFKRRGKKSWDILVSDFAEAALRADAGVTWYRSGGPDIYFDVVGWPILLTHGDAMGAGQGQGYIGPMASIVRGHRKTIDTEFRQRRPVYLVLTAHFHTSCITPFGAGNGSVVGFNEYVKGFRGDPEVAKQNLFVIHERYGLIRYAPLYLGVPSEGTLYQGFSGWLTPQVLNALQVEVP